MSNHGSRERILARIKKCLETQDRVKNETPRRPVFEQIGNLLERFISESKGNLTDCHLVQGTTSEKLSEILKELPLGEVFAEDSPGIRTALCRFPGEVRWSSDGPPRESAQATITSAHLLIAQTGSLLVSSSCGGRGASVVAPVHIVITGVSQLVADLDEALAIVKKKNLAEGNSFLGVITGCSRTGDIEKLLVIGAHGPKRLVVIVDSNG